MGMISNNTTTGYNYCNTNTLLNKNQQNSYYDQLSNEKYSYFDRNEQNHKYPK